MEHFVAEDIVGQLGLDLTDALFGKIGLSRLCGPGHQVDVRVLALVVEGSILSALVVAVMFQDSFRREAESLLRQHWASLNESQKKE